MTNFAKICVAIVVALVVGVVIACPMMIQTVDPGHVAVGTLFGKVDANELKEGLNFPVNPLKSWTTYDCRHKTMLIENIGIPTKDQQTTLFDLNIQFHIIDDQASNALSDTGTAEDLVNVHLIPTARSVLRREGKAVDRCEDFFNDEIQDTMQTNILAGLQDLSKKGIRVTGVLLRKPELPEHILKAIKDKKVREQEAEKQKAELLRFETEQQQIVVEAEAKKAAAEARAVEIQTLADAKAYEIEKVNKAAEGSPTYVQLQALESLREMSKDPATKLYFLNGESSQPFPLLNLGGDSPLTK